tara:strand:- start:616 stop:2877 length:2262 start_codon:yes stop_codon:yes gene_type:complete
MAEYTYPSNDLEQGKALLRTLGSFWSLVYDGSAQVDSYLRGRALVEQQSHLNLIEAAACAGRQTIPVFHEENWHLLRIKQSDMSEHTGNLLAYGDSAEYGDVNNYDEAQSGTYAVPIPSDLSEAPFIMNRITDPSLLLTAGVDYVVLPESNSIVFNENPFDNELIEQGELWEDGAVSDNDIYLWVFKGQFDYNYLYDHFAHVLGMRLRSTEPAKDLLNAVMDAVVGGTAQKQLVAAISAISGIPVVREISETVVDVTKDSRNLLVITDKHVYKFNATASAVVSIGDKVSAGQTLVNEFDVLEFNRGQLSSKISAIALSPKFLSTGFYGDLQFNNKSSNIVVTEGAPPFTITPSAVPSALSEFSTEGFTQYVNIFGIPVLATAGISYKKFLHAANVLAQYLDNDASGVVDNRAVVDAMIAQGAALLLTEDATELSDMDDSAWIAAGYGATQALYSAEINPADDFDVTLEKTLYLISQHGYAQAYPDVFGTSSESKLAKLMDIARGGVYTAVPEQYPASAWFHQYNTECDYSCQVVEYFYWVLSSILGIQSERRSVIRDDWDLPTKAEVKSEDPNTYELFTNTVYKLPDRAPDGNYTSYTKITFDVGGFPADVEKFFNEIHSRGVTNDKTLAHLLDTRTNKVGEPSADNLPTTINPLEFLAENVLRGNAFVVRLVASAFGPGHAGLEHIQFLRKIIPPHTAMLLLIELQGLKDSVSMVTGEDLSSFTGAAPLSDEISAPNDTDRTSIRLVTGTCQ